jgi:hypothetical protein
MYRLWPSSPLRPVQSIRGPDPTTLIQWAPAASRFAAGARSAVGSGGNNPALSNRQRVFARQQPERNRDLAPARHAELLPQNVAVRLGGPRGDPEPCSDLLVRASSCDEGDYLPLTCGYRRRLPLRGQLDHGHEATPSIEGRPLVQRCNPGCIASHRASDPSSETRDAKLWCRAETGGLAWRRSEIASLMSTTR